MAIIGVLTGVGTVEGRVRVPAERMERVECDEVSARAEAVADVKACA